MNVNQSRTRKRLVAEINVVPYIDVMLVLLVIFMVTTPLLTQGVDVDLPQATAKPLDDKSDEPIVVSVDHAGAYYLNITDNPSKPVTPTDMTTRVASEVQQAKQQGKIRSVLIKGDKAVNYGQVVNAMVLLQQVGIENVGLVTTNIGTETQ